MTLEYIAGVKKMAEYVQERHEKLAPVVLKIVACYVAILAVGVVVGGLF